MACNHISLIIRQPITIEAGFSQAQADLYNFLLQRFQEVERITLGEILEAMNSKVPAAIKTRLANLQEKGAIELSECSC